MECLYPLGLQHNINNLKGEICDVKLHIIHHVCMNIYALIGNYANGLIQSLEYVFAMYTIESS
jgi:hypothetical protein